MKGNMLYKLYLLYRWHLLLSSYSFYRYLLLNPKYTFFHSSLGQMCIMLMNMTSIQVHLCTQCHQKCNQSKLPGILRSKTQHKHYNRRNQGIYYRQKHIQRLRHILSLVCRVLDNSLYRWQQLPWHKNQQKQQLQQSKGSQSCYSHFRIQIECRHCIDLIF
ncbi:hypothetical protein FGO68_gene3974 [Halteria grandinella]|uniref:Uncharacterized protein n=1 Tax=Halteria grandinella TaxID=5974 RepID=A0A8J8NBC6_HALGN|nr:hypothetical protein FGO68_gene3974 [Halteria grandinella]